MSTGPSIPIGSNFTVENILKELTDLTNKREQAVYSWLRYLVGLASGALAILVALGSGLPASKANTFHRVAMVSLALGILLGSIRLYGEVWIARGHLNNSIKQIQQASSGVFPLEGFAVKPMPFSKSCERLCYICLVVALASLLVLAWTPPIPH